MKKIVLVSCVVLVAGAVFAGVPVELTNAGFHETDGKGGAVGWTAHPNWHAEKAGHNGSGALVWECASESEIKNGGPGQEVVLKPGRRYDFSAIIKADNLVTQRKSPYQGLTIYVEGYDAKGKLMFGDTARPAVAGKSEDWIKVEGVTREIPEGVSKAYFRAIAKRCVSGRGAVDNMFLAERETVAVEGVFPHVYRRESTGGNVRFSASINADVHENRIEDYAAKFTYVAADGKSVTLDGRVVSSVEAVATLDTSLFAFGTNDVICTLYLKGKEVGSASVPFARLKTPTSRRVYIDRHLRTIVDGKPFFPFGMCYWGNFTKKDIERYAEGPFNCVNTSWRMTGEQLDFCREKDLLVIVGLEHGFDMPDGGKAWLTERVNAMKAHPSVMGWFVSDEQPIADIPKMRRRQGWMEALDPDHPTWYALDTVREARHYLGAADVMGLDPYPIPTKPIGLVYSTTCRGVTNTFGAVANWQFPQAFGWGWLKRRETKGQRAPTQKEMANMGWQAIAGGANGLVFYAYQHLGEPHDDPEDAFEPAWTRTKAMAEEFKKYMNVFLSIDTAPSAESSNGNIALRTWRFGGDTYLLAVNCTTNSQVAAVTVSEPIRRVVSSDFGAKVELVDGALRFGFGSIDYAMVRLETGFPGESATGIDFQKLIDDAALAGGGVVTVPPGRHVTKGLFLKSNVELHLEKGASLEGSTNVADYAKVIMPYSEGDWMAVVMAVGVENVSITGEGEIFGNGRAWPMPEGYGGNQEGRRPRGLAFLGCRNIRLEDFSLRDAACWGIVFKCCDGVEARRVNISSQANINNDGFDVEARNVLIEDCDVESGDDSYCLKSNDPGFVVENVVVRRCTGRTFCYPFKLGTASHGVMRNVLFEDCRSELPRRFFMDTRFGRNRKMYANDHRNETNFLLADQENGVGHAAIAVECVDGGIVENVVFRNIDIAGVAAPIFIRGGTRSGRDCGTPPNDKHIIRDILVENVRGKWSSAMPCSISGVEGCRVKNVTFRNVHLHGPGAGECETEKTRPVPERPGAYPEANMFKCMLPAYGLWARHVDGLTLENVTFTLDSGTTDSRDAIVTDDVIDFRQVP